MQGDWLGNVVVVGFVLLVLLFLGAVLRKARARRRAEFGEETAPRQVEAHSGEDAEELTPQPDAAPAEEAEPDEKPPLAETTPEVEAADATEAAADGEVVAPVPPAAAAQEEVADPALERGLAKTKATLWGRLSEILRREPQLKASVIDELEEALLTADVGVSLTTRLLAQVRDDVKKGTATTPESVRAELKSKLAEALTAAHHADNPFLGADAKPQVILFVGVNGVGKTTTIGKVAQQLKAQGKNVLLAAGDTFRAAAVEQLGIWAERTGSTLYRGEPNSDPASVIFNAVKEATKVGADIVLADTAGRLHTKSDLMDEIKKVKRAAGKARDGAPDHVWLVVDATTGQNALQQAREFNQALGLSGVILTKLDGTAKGGVVVAIADALKLPVRFVGVGEKADDLRPFVAERFVSALFSDGA